MEEKKPQESQMDEEVIEESSAQVEAEGAKKENAEAESIEAEEMEDLSQVESAQAEAVTDSSEETIEAEGEAREVEAPKETDSADANAAEDVVKKENGEENVEAVEVDEANSKDAPVIENESASAEEPVKNLEIAKSKTGGAFAKWASTGLVIQSWQLAVAAVVVLTMVMGGVVLGVVLGNRNDPKDSDFDDSPVDYEWVMPEGGDTNEDQIILPGYVDLTFPAGEQEIEVVLPNPKGNPCYFRYTLRLEATGEILYQSKLIPPGKAVLEIKLSRSLPKGDYSLLIGIDSVSLADGRTPMNGGEQKVLLKVR